MEKIFFDDTTCIWKTKLNYISDKSSFLKEAYSLIESQPEIKSDGFGYKREWNEHLNFIGDINVELEEVLTY
jgi:hypothetical protein